MLGNFACFLLSVEVFENKLFQKINSGIHQSVKFYRLDSDQAHYFDWSCLGPIYQQMIQDSKAINVLVA